MRLLADECVPGATVRALREVGLDVAWMSDTAPGEADEAVLKRAYDEGRILVTEDKDFGELTVRLGHRTRGVIALALWSLPAAERTARAVAAIAAVGQEASGSLVIIEPSRLRRRPLLPQSSA